ncbi:MAG: DUF4388 domain-containing protein, partial [Myxococcales bacterium]
MDRKYWVRTEHGRVWGPYSVAALERLRGQLTESCEASIDGTEWHPGVDFPELRSLLAPTRKIERQASMPAAPPRISRAVAEAFGISDVTVAVSVTAAPPAGPEEERSGEAAAAPAPAPKPKPPPPPPAPAQLEVPDSGDLSHLSPARLYALAGFTSASGALRFELEKGGTLRIAFRRGTPEQLVCDDPELSLLRFLQAKKLLAPEQALAAEEQARSSGQDVVAVLFQLQLLPPADAARLLGDYSAFLLDRALVCWRGKFTFERDAPPPPGSFPLGSRWAMLTDSVRRLDVAPLRARLGKRLLLPVVRSGGLAIGKLEELALNAQEARIYAGIDGTRTGEELLRAHEGPFALRLLYLLTELGHLAFAGASDESESAPAPPQRPPEPAKAAAPKEAPV